MTINFNFKRYVKYFIIFLLCFIFFKSVNVGATGSFLNNTVNITTPSNTELIDVLYKGNYDNLNNYFVENYGITDFPTYVTNFKSKVATQMGYSSFDLLADDYYYMFQFWYRVNYFNGTLNTNIFLYKKDSIDKNLFVPYLSVKTENNVSSLTSNTSYNVVIRPNSFQKSYSNSISKSDFSSSFNINSGYNNYNFSCSRNSSYCSSTFNSSTLTPSLNIAGFINNGEPVWYETNNDILNFKFGTHGLSGSPSNVYFFQYLKINNSSNTYNIQDIIANVDFFIIQTPNVSDLGNNSYGINFNTIDNIFLDFDNNNSTTINCSDDRGFIGNVCYLYSSDISDYDVNNTNVSNSAIWYIGNSNVLSLDSSKYYVFSFRLYTSYNLDILATIYNFTNDSTDYPFNIINKYQQDYTLYKDYSIVFQPTHTGTGYLQYINVIFNTLDNFTSVLPDNLSFGVFRSVKLSQYDTQPTLTDVQNEFNNNSLDNISTSDVDGFFNDFRLNDHGLSSIVLYPLNFVSSFTNYTCSPLTLPLPRSMGSFQFPCVSTFMEDNFLSIWNIFKLVFNGFIIYRILINLYSLIKNSYKPDNDRIEVVDL